MKGGFPTISGAKVPSCQVAKSPSCRFAKLPRCQSGGGVKKEANFCCRHITGSFTGKLVLRSEFNNITSIRTVLSHRHSICSGLMGGIHSSAGRLRDIKVKRLFEEKRSNDDGYSSSHTRSENETFIKQTRHTTPVEIYHLKVSHPVHAVFSLSPPRLKQLAFCGTKKYRYQSKG